MRLDSEKVFASIGVRLMCRLSSPPNTQVPFPQRLWCSYPVPFLAGFARSVLELYICLKPCPLFTLPWPMNFRGSRPGFMSPKAHTHYELFSTPDHGLLKLEPNRSLGNKHMLCMLDLIFYFKLKKKKLHIKAVLVYTDGLCNEEVGQAGFSQLE